MHEATALFDDALKNKKHVGNITNYYDLSRVNFSKVEGYGVQHAQRAQRLAEYIARNIYKLPPQETRIVGFAATFYDLGRTQPFYAEDHGCRNESLRLAHEVLTVDAEFSKYIALHERVLRIIAQHDPDGPAPSEPLAVSLWDADALEALRHAPDTDTGARYARKRLARAVTPWARMPAIQQHYAQYCGWKGAFA